MGFLEHLDELRTRLIRSVVALAAGMGAAFFFRNQIARFVLGPVERALSPGTGLVAGLTEGFSFSIDLALIGGVILAAPFVTYQIWRFAAPGLYARERHLVAPLLLLSATGAVGGAAFSHYFLFPSSVDFFSKMLPPGVKLLPTLGETFGLYKSMMIAMVAAFQLPALILLLARLGLVTSRLLWRNMKYAMLLALVASALLTPTGDPWNMVFTAAPMLAMYVMSIGIAWLARPRDTDIVAVGTLGLVISAAAFERARRQRRLGGRRPVHNRPALVP